MNNMIQRYISQPSDKHIGWFEVAKFSPKEQCYIPLKGEVFQIEADAKARAHELNN